ncbi:uncharacterized protein LOC128160521 isoform X2 [Crassostrea angulata]|uniref:uncharacterized protein LOC128160521 isoform X2 n=1 Tax=Magallana angulata TaxID=2784310 RepID=UPI0022B0A70F|nr:uncharacterized protein LOC128160521 isoform X2 [Crassostrea angulata]
MAVGFYGYLFCVLCVSDLLNVASAVCQYMKQDIVFKVVKSDVVLTGTVNGITSGDDKYFPGIPGAKTIEMTIDCIYKGPSMNSAVKIYGVGIFEDKAGKCHNTTVAKDREAIVYLEQKSNGDLLMKYLNDPIYFADELTICGQDPPKLVSDHAEPDYVDDYCPWNGDDCSVYRTTPASTTTEAPTHKPEPMTEPNLEQQQNYM